MAIAECFFGDVNFCFEVWVWILKVGFRVHGAVNGEDGDRIWWHGWWGSERIEVVGFPFCDGGCSSSGWFGLLPFEVCAWGGESVLVCSGRGVVTS